MVDADDWITEHVKGTEHITNSDKERSWTSYLARYAGSDYSEYSTKMWRKPPLSFAASTQIVSNTVYGVALHHGDETTEFERNTKKKLDWVAFFWFLKIKRAICSVFLISVSPHHFFFTFLTVGDNKTTTWAKTSITSTHSRSYIAK